ncbi:hypothetical protein CYFUS_006790 [Cystobacter fuscus]|uniref:Uncharacterized protein n=1 Tax=Cystobacter fuscus TaxID=43 RepID=A0A250JBP6_9BACT|nr:hypothetical protein [Cystobacter fuscus]ATB41325.1 hypothetical protein CYFUS_006790 [Cystobacter fuscus]
MATSPKRVNLRPASNLRDLLLNIPMNAGTNVNDDDGRGRTWERLHRHLGVLHPLNNGYACGNFALSGGTDGNFNELGTEHSVPLSWIIDPYGRNPYRVYYNHTGIDPGRVARTRDGDEYAWKGRYAYQGRNNVLDDHAAVFNFIPGVIGDNGEMPNPNYSLSGSEWTGLQNLWRDACREALRWKKVGRRGNGGRASFNDAETTSDWGDRLRSLDDHEALNAAEQSVLRNRGPLHDSASMKFFHKLMKRVAELYGWKIKDYDEAPNPGRAMGYRNGVGIAVTSCSWWAADHWGFVVTNARNPDGDDMPYAFFQQVPTCNGNLDCYGTRLWDEGRAITVLWVESVPQLVLDKIRDHYY